MTMSEQPRIPGSNIDLLKRYVYPKLSVINPVRGCGPRPCYICSEISPVYQTSLPLDVLNTLFSTYSGDKQLMLFGQGDPIYFNDKDYSITDVFAAAHEAKVRIYARTHGCLREETKTIAAVKNLVAYLIGNNLPKNQARLDLSIDEYGWFGVEPEEHIASIENFYSIIAPLKPTVFAFSNNNAQDNELGSSTRLDELLNQVQIPDRDVAYQDIYYFKEGDRPSRIQPKPPRATSFEPWHGTFIDADGTIL